MRGFRESRLGPKDSFGSPYGGNIKIVAQTELLLPMPDKWRNSARFSVFFDIGNMFSTRTSASGSSACDGAHAGRLRVRLQ